MRSRGAAWIGDAILKGDDDARPALLATGYVAVRYLILLHHRVLIVPIVDGGRVSGIVTREDFSRSLTERLLAPP